jgi:hypothetical protein
MKTAKIISVGIVSVLSCLFVCSAHAQSPLPPDDVIRIHLVARQNGSVKSTENATVYREKTTIINTAKVLRWLGDATTNDFTGAQLRCRDDRSKFMVVEGTNEVADISPFFSSSMPYQNQVYHGREDVDWNSAPGSGRHAIARSYLYMFRFDDKAGNWFYVSGMTTTALNDRTGTNGIQISQDSVLRCTGTGEIGGERAVFSGLITFRRHGPFRYPSD